MTDYKLQAAPPQIDEREFGGKQPHCDWGEEICLESPTHVVVFNLSEDNAEAARLCARHYVLTLTKHVEIHTYLCERTIRDHFLAIGPLSDPQKLPELPLNHGQ